MFNTIVPLAEPIVAVQADAEQLEGSAGAELLAKLEAYFMRPVALVAWDQDSRFLIRGFQVAESVLTHDDLQWRQFELPPEPEIPF